MVLSASFTAIKYAILGSDVILMVDVAVIGRHCESWWVVLGQATLLVVLKKRFTIVSKSMKQCMVSILIKNNCFVCKSTRSGKSGAVVFEGFPFRFIYKVAEMVGWWRLYL